MRDRAKEVTSILEDDLHWEMVDFLLDLGRGFVTGVRLFDGAKSGSVCVVYKMWSLLACSMSSAFEKSWGKGFVTNDLYQRVQDQINRDWAKFHYDIFAAGFFGNPQLRSEVLEMRLKENDEYAELRKQTIKVGATMLRRFAFEVGVDLREEILAEDDERLVTLLAIFEDELDDYLLGEAKFGDVTIDKSKSPNREFRQRPCPRTNHPLDF